MAARPPVIGTDLYQWGRHLNQYLQRYVGRVFFKTSDDNPSENGILLWDDENGYPVISSANSFIEIVMKHGVPSANTGSSGDTDGMITWDENYIYVCTADYDGTSAIWKRVALSTW